MAMRICKGVYEFLTWSLNVCWGALTVFLAVIVDSSVIELFIK
jgi:hypothetical protein